MILADERQRQLLQWLQHNPDHQGLKVREIRNQSGLYKDVPHSPGMEDFACSYDLNTLKLDRLTRTDWRYCGRWWPMPKRRWQ